MIVIAPRRASHSYVQQLVAPPQQVFALMCPVREADWLDGWDPVLVVSHSGVAERDCVFVTAAAGVQSVWTILRHDADAGLVEMLKVTPGVTVCRLTIELAAAPGGATARVTYTHTSLGPEGDRFVDGFTADAYAGAMRNWERRLNHYLRSGSCLRDG